VTQPGEICAVNMGSRSCLPFVTAVMTDVCVHLLNNSSWKCHQLAAAKLSRMDAVKGQHSMGCDGCEFCDGWSTPPSLTDRNAYPGLEI
jgi:hypothetical protein